MDGFSAEYPSGTTLNIPNRKACALLGYLALNPTGRESRERLAGLLWSERGEIQARGSLRQCLKQLRTLFGKIGFPGFTAERHDIVLSGVHVDTDLDAALTCLQSGVVDRSLLDTAGTPDRILYGFETLDQSFATWLHVTRQSWHERLLAELQPLMTAGSGAHHLAAETIVHLDPTHEEAHRHLIRYHADAGNTAAAIKQYNALWDVLDVEFDMEPDDLTQALIAEVKAGTYEACALVPRETPPVNSMSHPGNGSATLSPVPPRLPTIGVAEFVPGGPWTQEDYLIGGFRRELVAALVRFREWIVLESPAVTAKATPLQASVPDVDYQLEGTYLEEDGDIRLVVTLKETKTYRFVWSEQITLSLGNWTAAQKDLVRRISIAFNVYISAERISRRVASPGIPAKAFDQWLKGHDLIHQWDPETELQAEEIFRRIIAEVPSFAPAYSSLASILNSRHIVFPGLFPDPKLLQQSLGLSQSAVELDPLDTRGQLALAWSNAMAGRYELAEMHYGLAYDLNPNNPMTMISAAHGFAFCGAKEKAAELASLAEQINPAMPAFHWGYMVGIRFMCGDYKGAVAASDRASNIISDLPGWRAAAFGALGEKRRAEKAAHDFLESVNEKWRSDLPCTEENVVKWFLDSFPIKEGKDRSRLKQGLHKAGLAVSTA